MYRGVTYTLPVSTLLGVFLRRCNFAALQALCFAPPAEAGQKVGQVFGGGAAGHHQPAPTQHAPTMRHSKKHNEKGALICVRAQTRGHALCMCKVCMKALAAKKVPEFSLPRVDIGEVPPELPPLSMIEEQLLAPCRANARDHLVRQAERGRQLACRQDLQSCPARPCGGLAKPWC